MLKKILLLLGLFVLTACSNSTITKTETETVNYQSQDEVQFDNLITKIRTNEPHNGQLAYSPVSHQKLTQIYQEWVGTRYRLGGTSKRGIDCSAFMQTTFADAFGMNLPRSTSEQRTMGRKIGKNELRVGDLVFFRKNRHVGVYLGNGQFMHASSSQGVTISSIHENYWVKTYSQSRRIL